ncbi:MAG: DUF721 domain-containing protein [Alphaproteobacteria bacterium]|nr:DUF721 domain-containing protein [Alphaproteobacteria bacterium]
MAKKLTICSEHKTKDLTALSKTMMPLIKQLLGTRGLIEIELLLNWKTIVGENVAHFSLPQKITFRKDERTDGCLTISVLSGAFAMEIKQNETTILEKINAYFGYKAVSKLKILQNANPADFSVSKKNTDNLKKCLVSGAEENYITELVKDVENSALRQTLANLGVAVIAQRKK